MHKGLSYQKRENSKMTTQITRIIPGTVNPVPGVCGRLINVGVVNKCVVESDLLLGKI